MICHALCEYSLETTTLCPMFPPRTPFYDTLLTTAAYARNIMRNKTLFTYNRVHSVTTHIQTVLKELWRVSLQNVSRSTGRTTHSVIASLQQVSQWTIDYAFLRNSPATTAANATDATVAANASHFAPHPQPFLSASSLLGAALFAVYLSILRVLCGRRRRAQTPVADAKAQRSKAPLPVRRAHACAPLSPGPSTLLAYKGQDDAAVKQFSEKPGVCVKENTSATANGSACCRVKSETDEEDVKFDMSFLCPTAPTSFPAPVFSHVSITSLCLCSCVPCMCDTIAEMVNDYANE